MPKFSDLLSKAVFKTAPRSAFPQPNELKYSSKIGLRYPIMRWMMNPGDTIDVDMQQLTRFAPLAAPIMHHFTTEFIAVDIPDRLSMPYNGNAAGYLDGGQEQFHNLFPASAGDNMYKQVMPTVTLDKYVAWLLAYKINPIGTLLDFLGYPCFKDLYREITKKGDYFLKADNIGFDTDFLGVYALNLSVSLYDANISYQGVRLGSATPGQDTPVYTFITWLADNIGYRSVDLYKLVSDSGIDINSVKVTDPSGEHEFALPDSVFLDWLLSKNGFTAAEASHAYFDYVFATCLGSWLYNADAQGAVQNAQPLSLDPLNKYWVGTFDWFINTNIDKPLSKADWLSSVGVQFTDNASFDWLPADATKAVKYVTPANALWNDDYFTSAFTTPAAGGSVPMAGISTIQQFREAESVDRLRILLQYAGRRTKDQNEGLFGVKSSDARFDRCQVVGVARFSQQIEDVTQTSASDVNGMLGDYAGKSISVGQQKKFIHFTAEEHSTVMVFAVVKPIAVYEQCMPADILKISPYDYLIPYLSNVGEQIVRKLEIYPTISASVDDGFGWQRRYAEYMHSHSRIMGDFGTSLDFWHDAREFDSMPALNKQFVSVDISQDNLDRIFAVQGNLENLRSFVYFDTVISRPLPKYVKYGVQ